uniref:Uncharacterized protein n=1 Tax=Oryza glumipatula TaxID=40148 RepID=A0A0E0AQC2_9ORYZ
MLVTLSAECHPVKGCRRLTETPPAGDAFTLVAVSSVTIDVYSIIFDGATTFLTLIMKPLEEIAIRSAAARCLHAVLPERTTDRRSTRGSTLPSCPDPGGLDGAVGDARRAALALKLVTIIMQLRHCHVVFVLADQTLSHCLPEHVGLRQSAIARGPYAVIKTGRDSFSSSSRGRCAVCPQRFHFIMLESFVMSRDHHVGAPLLGAYKPSSSRSRRAVSFSIHLMMRCHLSMMLSLHHAKMRYCLSVMLSLFVEINDAARRCIGASLVHINIKQEWCRL